MDYKIMSRDEWLAERKRGIGGSDVAAVLGLSPWRSPLDVWLEKTGKSAPAAENEAMYWGTRLEALVAAKYSEESGFKVQRVNAILRSKEFPCLIGNIDRAVCVEAGKQPVVRGEFRTPKILECKTARTQNDDWGEDGTDEVPAYYLTQCLHYLGLTGCKSCDLAVLFLDSRKFRVYTVETDAGLIAEMFARLADWWNEHVVKGVAPAPRSAAEVQKRFKLSVSAQITATAEIEELAHSYAMLKNDAALIERKMAEARDKIAAFMGENDTLVDLADRPLITWKSGKNRFTTDWEAVANAAGASAELIAAHTTMRPGNRTFLAKIKQ